MQWNCTIAFPLNDRCGGATATFRPGSLFPRYPSSLVRSYRKPCFYEEQQDIVSPIQDMPAQCGSCIISIEFLFAVCRGAISQAFL